MCESAVYMMKGSEKVMVMQEASRILVSGKDIICVDPVGERTTIQGARIADANLARHEIIIKAL